MQLHQSVEVAVLRLLVLVLVVLLLKENSGQRRQEKKTANHGRSGWRPCDVSRWRGGLRTGVIRDPTRVWVREHESEDEIVSMLMKRIKFILARRRGNDGRVTERRFGQPMRFLCSGRLPSSRPPEQRDLNFGAERLRFEAAGTKK
jgi:hypothetical protein